MRLSREIPANAGVSSLCGGQGPPKAQNGSQPVPSRCPRESRWPPQRGDGGGVLCTPPPGASSYEPLMPCRMSRCAIFWRVGRRADAHRLRVCHDRRERGVGAAVPVGIDELGQVERPVREVQPCRQELAVELLCLALRRCCFTFMTSNASATVASDRHFVEDRAHEPRDREVAQPSCLGERGRSGPVLGLPVTRAALVRRVPTDDDRHAVCLLRSHRRRRSRRRRRCRSMPPRTHAAPDPPPSAGCSSGSETDPGR